MGAPHHLAPPSPCPPLHCVALQDPPDVRWPAPADAGQGPAGAVEAMSEGWGGPAHAREGRQDRGVMQAPGLICCPRPPARCRASRCTSLCGAAAWPAPTSRLRCEAGREGKQQQPAWVKEACRPCVRPGAACHPCHPRLRLKPLTCPLPPPPQQGVGSTARMLVSDVPVCSVRSGQWAKGDCRCCC